MDVSASRGLDLVFLDADRQLVGPPVSKVTADGLHALLEERRPVAVAIDAPSGWASSGRSRSGERALARLGIASYATPTQEIAAGRDFYRWVEHGHAAFAAAEAAGYRRYDGSGSTEGCVFEVFPHATAVVLAGALPERGSKKREVRTAVLRGAGVPVHELRTQDHLDAALAALTAALASQGERTALGDAADGFIVVPSRTLPARRYVRPTAESMSEPVRTLSAMALALPSGALTIDDLETIERGGRRHELYDGALVVTPSPSARHQRVVVNLILLLGAAAPPHLEVLTAPYDWMVRSDTVFQPDLLVARREVLDRSPQRLEAPPELVIEVLSPSTRPFDLAAKRMAYADAGTPRYWIVDPDEPSLTVLRLEDGAYVEVASGGGTDEIQLLEPFEVTVTPSLLLD